MVPPPPPRLNALRYVVRQHCFSVVESGGLLCWGRTTGGSQASCRLFARHLLLSQRHLHPATAPPVAVALLHTAAGWRLWAKEQPQQSRLQQNGRDAGTKDIDVLRERPFKDLPFGEKVKQTGKDATYLTIIIAGLGVTGMMFFFIGRELFSSESPNGVYSSAIKKCQSNYEVADALGEPIKAYGEMTRRGRRQHPSYMEFTVAGRQAMRMKFYLEGTSRHATVHLEVRKNERGRYEYEYLIVELDDGYGGGRKIFVERSQQ